jgi:CDGSH-type Zn-finger protein
MNKIITMTACRRPEYTQKVLESLARCTGSSEYKLVPFCDGPHQQVIDVFKGVDFCEVEVNVNKKRLGHTQNTHKALSRGFELSDYVILLEDDTVLSKDFLEFHEHCRENFKDDESVYTVSAGHYNNIDKKYSEEERSLYKRNQWFSNQGWGTWIDRWEEEGGIKHNWEAPETVGYGVYITNYKYGGWDGLINKHARKGRDEILSVVSRVKNIGAREGVHFGYPPNYRSFEEYHKDQIEVQDWCGLYDLKGLTYEEQITSSFSEFVIQ